MASLIVFNYLSIYIFCPQTSLAFPFFAHHRLWASYNAAAETPVFKDITGYDSLAALCTSDRPADSLLCKLSARIFHSEVSGTLRSWIEKMQLTTATNIRVTVLLQLFLLTIAEKSRSTAETGLLGRRVIVNVQQVTIAWVAFTSRQENDESPVNDRILRIRVI
jgi:hypothetical protein